MLRIGLTGGIGSGKSTVTEEFAALGISVIDTDIIARELTAPGTDALQDIAEAFGSAVIASNGELDRHLLRQLVFKDDRKRLQLETILHPLIKHRAIELAEQARSPYCLVVVPLLLEKNWQSLVDRILVVDCPTDLQMQRTQQRDGLSESEVRAIIGTQFSRVQRLAAADDIIVNDGAKIDLKRQIMQLHFKYLKLAATQAS